jgi:hypothetical protein
VNRGYRFLARAYKFHVPIVELYLRGAEVAEHMHIRFHARSNGLGKCDADGFIPAALPYCNNIDVFARTAEQAIAHKAANDVGVDLKLLSFFRDDGKHGV